jgi:hypothetical protein
LRGYVRYFSLLFFCTTSPPLRSNFRGDVDFLGQIDGKNFGHWVDPAGPNIPFTLAVATGADVDYRAVGDLLPRFTRASALGGQPMDGVAEPAGLLDRVLKAARVRRWDKLTYSAGRRGMGA